MKVKKNLSMCIAAAIAGAAGVSASYAADVGKVRVLEEIIVAGEKRDVNLQDAAIAISALTSDTLDSQNITNPIDLSNTVPGLQIAKSEGLRRIVAIRGLGLEANQNDIANPSVSFHIDGVYIASDISLNSDLLDVERVEVLRGPQGTVFGQNSIGGTINVISKAPDTEAFGGEVDVALGNHDQRTVRGVLNIPFSERAALRIAASHTEHEGYSDNVLTGKDLDDADNNTIKAQLLVDITDNLSLTLRAEYGESETNGSAQKNILDTTPGARNLAHDFLESFEYDSKIYSWTLERAGEFADIKYVGSIQDTFAVVVNDNDRTSAPLDIVPKFLKQLDTTTHEINIVSSGDNRVDWIVGAFYLDFDHRSNFLEFVDGNGDGAIDQTINLANPFSNPDLGFQTDTTPNRESWSLYGQATFHVTDTFRATAGLRKTDESVDVEVRNFFTPPGAGTRVKQNADDVSGKLGVEWDVTEDSLLYATVSQGFKPGGTNLSFNNIFVQPTYDDETITAYEIGTKNRFFDDRLQLNASAFFYDYENLQYAATEARVFAGGVSNIADSEVRGIEIELVSPLTERLTIDANLSFLDTEITSNTIAIDQAFAQEVTDALLAQGFSFFGPEVEAARAGLASSIEGNDLPKAPKVTANLSLIYDQPFEAGTLTSTLRASYRDEFSYRVFNAARDILPSYELINLHLLWTPSDANWNLELIATNLADEDAIISRQTDVFGVGATSDSLVAPRSFILRAGYSF